MARRIRFFSYYDRKKICTALPELYTAPTVEAAEATLLVFGDFELGGR